MALCVPLLALGICGGTGGEPLPGVADGGAVVIELFTSQGCSSCPPADRLLRRLAAEPSYRGRVYPLAFHVDYWNYIGWRDPFSSAQWSERQRDYGRALGVGTVYTPQLVVNGRAECVGSREDEVRREIGRALAVPPAGSVEIELDAVGPASTLRVGVRARLERPVEGRRVEVLAALFQDGLATAVERGENSGRALENDRVVRRLERVFTLPADGRRAGEGRIVFQLEPAWPRAALGVVAFLQDADSLAILGAAGSPLHFTNP